MENTLYSKINIMYYLTLVAALSKQLEQFQLLVGQLLS